MDTNRIRYFLTLARTGSVSQAAELHRISPAAFSKAMKVLASEFGIQLSIPSGRGIALTDKARTLVPELTEVIGRLDALKNAQTGSAEDASLRSCLRIASFEVFSTYFFENVLGRDFPEYSCEIHEMIPGEMERAVASRLVDLALTYIPIPHPDLDFIRIAPIEMGVYGRVRGKAPTDLGKIPFAVPMSPLEGAPNKITGLDGWPDDAFPRTVRYRVGLLETALGLCRRGLAYAYIPKFVVRLHNEVVREPMALKELELPSGFKRRRDFVYLVKRKSDIEGTELKRISSAVRKLCST